VFGVVCLVVRRHDRVTGAGGRRRLQCPSRLSGQQLVHLVIPVAPAHPYWGWSVGRRAGQLRRGLAGLGGSSERGV